MKSLGNSHPMHHNSRPFRSIPFILVHLSHLLSIGVSVAPQVVKEIVLSDNLLIEQSDQLRRMDVGEVMEVFQGRDGTEKGRTAAR